MDELQITLDDGALLRAIDNAITLLARPRPLLEDIGGKLESNALQRFDSKTDPEGTPWAGLRPATVEIYQSEWFKKDNPKFRNGIPGSLLVRTEQLRDSLAYNVGDEWIDLGMSRKTKSGRWEVGQLLEWGTRKMQRRGILTADPATGRLGAGDEADVLQIVNDALLGAFD